MKWVGSNLSTRQQTARAIVVFAVIVMVTCSWLAPFESRANEQVDAGLKRALATYATARLLNGVISVIQGTEISAAPVGIGMTFTPGQILDPLNDLIEQFSQVMLVALVAFGIQKTLLMIGASWVISLAMSLVAFGWAAMYLLGMVSPLWLRRLLLVLLLCRFVMPITLIGSETVFQNFLASDYRESQQVLQAMHSSASKLDPTAQTDNISFGIGDKIKEVVGGARLRFENLKIATEKAVERVIRLMVIFVLETIVVPLLFAWAFFALVKGSFDTVQAPAPKGYPPSK